MSEELRLGDEVTWFSCGRRKTGTIAEVVEPGGIPSAQFTRIAAGHTRRDDVSYVIVTHDGRAPGQYWPHARWLTLVRPAVHDDVAAWLECEAAFYDNDDPADNQTAAALKRSAAMLRDGSWERRPR